MRDRKPSTILFVWLVRGETGEYDNYRSWLTLVLDNEASAATYIKGCNIWLSKRDMHSRNTVIANAEDRRNVRCPFDPHLIVYPTGANYYIARIPFLRSGYSYEE